MKRSTGPGTKGEASRSAASVRDARLPGLDGLRAVAVVAVILFHLNLPGVLPAGFLGVDIFFTLSGFIITALLLREHARNGRVDWLAFCGRRARRLLPPTLAMIALAVPLTALVAPEALQRLRADLPAALLYVSNWWQIHSQQSYFEALARAARAAAPVVAGHRRAVLPAVAAGLGCGAALARPHRAGRELLAGGAGQQRLDGLAAPGPGRRRRPEPRVPGLGHACDGPLRRRGIGVHPRPVARGGDRRCSRRSGGQRRCSRHCGGPRSPARRCGTASVSLRCWLPCWRCSNCTKPPRRCSKAGSWCWRSPRRC
ncbi:MAG: acyltransferase [Rubrivivax sp.]